MSADDASLKSSMVSWLSSARYSTYESAAMGDAEVALALYQWNVGLAQALLRDVSFFEVALRNAYDRVLSAEFEADEHWLIDSTSPIRRPIMRRNRRGNVADVNDFYRRTVDHLRRRMGTGCTTNDLIANLTLGFWTHMTDRAHERDLWIPIISKAWPAGTSRVVLNGEITAINSARNRAAHQEHLFNMTTGLSVLKAGEDAVRLFSTLQPEVSERVYGPDPISSVEQYVQTNEAPCVVVL